jgi:hypothetical protein
MPGDGLYAVKRSTERAQLALASSDVSRGQLYLQFAQVRLGEARGAQPRYLHEILLDMNAETRLGMKLLGTTAIDRRDPAALDTIDTFVTVQRRPLLDLVDALPDGRRGEVLAALTILDSVAARAQSLRTAVSCGGSAGIDELGPRPRPCVAEGPGTGQHSRSTTPANGEHPTASGVNAATAPVPSPATATPTPAASSAVAAATDETAKKDKKDKKDKDDGVIDKLGRLFGSLLGN